MAYSSLEDLNNRISEEELIQLTDDANLGVIDTQLVDDLRLEADDLIDQHLKGRAELPLALVPPVIQGISVDLTLYLLHLRRSGEVPPAVTEQRKTALNLLEYFRDGKLSLADAVTIEKNPNFRIQSGAAWFDSENLERY